MFIYGYIYISKYFIHSKGYNIKCITSYADTTDSYIHKYLTEVNFLKI